MSETEQDLTEDSRSGCAGCSVAVALVFLPGVLLSVLTGPLPGAEWPVALFFGLLVAVPFAYLALSGTTAWLPWVVTTLLTVLFWGASATSVLISARHQTGLNVWIVVVMFASPFVITFAAWLASRRTMSAVDPKQH